MDIVTRGPQNLIGNDKEDIIFDAFPMELAARVHKEMIGNHVKTLFFFLCSLDLGTRGPQKLIEHDTTDINVDAFSLIFFASYIERPNKF